MSDRLVVQAGELNPMLCLCDPILKRKFQEALQRAMLAELTQLVPFQRDALCLEARLEM